MTERRVAGWRTSQQSVQYAVAEGIGLVAVTTVSAAATAATIPTETAHWAAGRSSDRVRGRDRSGGGREESSEAGDTA